MNRKIGRAILNHADNDCWEKCFKLFRLDARYHNKDHLTPSIATPLQSPTKKKIWLHDVVEDSGDSLIHLCSFACCEEDMASERNKIFAMACFILLLKWEGLRVSQKVAADGGSPIHCALAAASSPSLSNNSDDEDNNTVSDESYHDDSDDDNDSFENNGKGKQSYKEGDIDPLLLYNEALSIVEENRDGFSSIKSQQLGHDVHVKQTLLSLLEAGADPNAPLSNIFYNNNRMDEDSENEAELSYARESIEQQWSPLVMIIVWIALRIRKPHLYGLKNETDNFDRNDISIRVLSILIDHGADSTYTVGGKNSHNYNNIKSEWLPIEFAAICLAGCKNVLNFTDESNSIKRQSVWKYVQSILTKGDRASNSSSAKLSSVQSFIVSILDNDVQTASSQLSSASQGLKSDKHPALFIVSEHFPLPEMMFGTSGASTESIATSTKLPNMTLLEMACMFQSLDSVQFLLGLLDQYQTEQSDIIVSEELCRNSILALFQKASFLNDRTSDLQTNVFYMNICDQIIEIYVKHCSKTQNLRQEFLDKLLLSTCAKSSFVSNLPKETESSSDTLLTLLLKLGADPNVDSLISEKESKVKDNQRPLHIIAGCRRDLQATQDIQQLLSIESASNEFKIQKIDVFIKNSNGLTPMQVALKYKNYRVAESLWNHSSSMQHFTCAKDDPSTSIDENLYTLGLTAIECQNIEMFRFSVNFLKNKGELMKNSSIERNEIQTYLGKLLLWIIDERSGGFGFGQKLKHQQDNGQTVTNVSLVETAVFEILSLGNMSPDNDILPYILQQEVSKKTVLHLILMGEKWCNVRNVLLPTLCRLAQVQSKLQIPSVNFLSLPCHKDFGEYTPLSLAHALQCEESINILLEYGADTTDFQDGQRANP